MSEYNKNSRMSSIKKYVKEHKNEIAICTVSALSTSFGYYFATKTYKKPSELSNLIHSIVDDNTSVVITKAKDMVNTFPIIAMENEYIDFTHVK